MKGDFSRWRSGAHRNFNGILPQQGKVLLDSDGIAQTMLANDWQQTAARDWVGECAGVPQSEPNSFLVTNAALPAGGVVTLTVDTGRIWADGLLVRLMGSAGATSVSRTATWLEPPIVPNEGSAGDVAVSTVDTVVLEVWQRAVNGFAMPHELIEPALGGPDTAERLQTECAFRLARLAAGQTCTSLTYNESSRGTLNVSLVPTVATGGDCPPDATGGYSGFEHQLYRIEIADTSAAFSEFKWSRINGGLVGRGTFDPGTQTLTMDANAVAVNSYNQTAFYLEIESYDTALGFARVIAGANATLNAGVLQLTAAPHFGTYPTASGEVFFRLWDGIAAVSAYPIVSGGTSPTLLENGIQLQFAAEPPASYLPGDYWMFPVRAQGIANPSVLINSEQPQGIRYHRVPLAEITWASDGAGGFVSSAIEDCRDPMYPITQTQGCCTNRVGDGVESFGDFTSIQAAICALPPAGGEVCILPGRYFENVVIYGCQDVVIHGCGWQTRVASASLSPHWNGKAPAWVGENQKKSGVQAVFTVMNSAHIQFRSFAVESAEGEAGILIDGQDTELLPGTKLCAAGQQGPAGLRFTAKLRSVEDTTIEGLVMTAAQYPAILAVKATQLVIRENRIVMSDESSNWQAVTVTGNLIYIENNLVTLATKATIAMFLPATVAAEIVTTLPDANGDMLNPGGIQVGGPSSNIYIRSNEIVSGSRNGITLGSVIALDGSQQVTGGWNGVYVGGSDDCCTGGLTIGETTGGSTTVTYVNAGLLQNINIECNTISGMGLCGIGPVGYFNQADQYEVISVRGLSIVGNSISDTVERAIDNSKATAATALMGVGAITLPDVSSLTIRDNTITDFGQSPGVQISGIFVLFGEGIEISRNKIAETRDWGSTSTENTNSDVVAGGIIIMFASPPAVGFATIVSGKEVFEPGIPAVRISDNTVRVALGQGLAILGLGPMAIVNNHLTTGGTVANSTFQLAETLCILNLGSGIDFSNLGSGGARALYDASQAPYTGLAGTSRGSSLVSNGTVLCSNNICQLEARESGQTELASVLIFTPDSLIFSNNVSWLDAAGSSAWIDVLLIAGTLQAMGNRMQEPLGTTLLSGFTIGAFNITTQNITTACLLALPSTAVNTGNIVVMDLGTQTLCTQSLGSLAVANT